MMPEESKVNAALGKKSKSNFKARKLGCFLPMQGKG